LPRLLVQGLGLKFFIEGYHLLPAEIQGRYVAGFTRRASATPGERLLYGDAEERLNDVTIGNRPLVVLSAFGDKHRVPGFHDYWIERQHHLLRLSPRSRQIPLEEVAHYIQIWRPELVVGSIKDVVMEARKDLAIGTPGESLAHAAK
jgi:hypothetical protein